MGELVEKFPLKYLENDPKKAQERLEAGESHKEVIGSIPVEYLVTTVRCFIFKRTLKSKKEYKKPSRSRMRTKT